MEIPPWLCWCVEKARPWPSCSPASTRPSPRLTTKRSLQTRSIPKPQTRTFHGRRNPPSRCSPRTLTEIQHLTFHQQWQLSCQTSSLKQSTAKLLRGKWIIDNRLRRTYEDHWRKHG